MSGRAPLWLGLSLAIAGLVVLGIGVATTGIDSGRPRDGNVAGPGSPGFVAGTIETPRVVRIVATAQLRFVPDTVIVKHGETVTFEVTSIGPLTHEFMVGPAADVAADKPGTPEVADIGMMRTGTVTYTFDGPGPYAFACHVTGHFEAGMAGTITVVP